MHVLYSEIMVVFSSNIVILPSITERGWTLVVCDRVHEFKLCEIYEFIIGQYVVQVEYWLCMGCVVTCD
jgi:hypothetical protein